MRIVAMLLVALLYSALGKAQQNIPDSITKKLANRLSVTKEKVIQIHAAYSYNQNEIEHTLKRTDLSPQQKHLQVRILLNQRRAKLDSILTPQLKAKLRLDAADSTKLAAFREAAMRKHEQDMNAVVHKRVLRRLTDSNQTKAKSSKP